MDSSKPIPPPLPQSLLGQFLFFLRRPLYSPPQAQPEREPLVPILRLYSLSICLIIPVAMVLQLISSLFFNLQDKHELNQVLQNESPHMVLILAVVIAPVLEETIFRLPLRYAPQNVVLPFFWVALALFSNVLGSSRLLISIGVVVLLSCGLGYGLRRGVNPIVAKAFFAKYLKPLVYGTSFAFGAVHLTNYPPEAWPLAPILVAPQLIIGLFLAFIRLRYGFKWAIFTHGFHNLMALSMILIPLILGSQNLKDRILLSNSEAQLLNQDYVLLGGLTLLVLIGLNLVIFTTYRLLREWQEEKRRARPQVTK